MLPTFLVIGARKAGTVAIFQYLRDHPEVSVSAKKELDFFVEERNWSKGEAWYREQFPDGKAAGEASPQYTNYPIYDGVPHRIAETIPDVRLIYLVRDPLDRIRTDYVDMVLRGLEHRPIGEALRADPGYLDRSRYGMQVERYLEVFPRRQLLVVRSEDMRDSRMETLRRIYAFIDVDDGWESPVLQRQYHSTADWRIPRRTIARVRLSRPYRAASNLAPQFVKTAIRPAITRKFGRVRPELPDDLRAEYEEILREDVDRLRSLVGGDFDGWRLG